MFPWLFVHFGDRVTLYLPDDVLAEKTVYYDFLSASKTLDVVYEDENLLILNKPQGLLCHPNGKEYVDTLIARVKRYLYERNQWSPEDSGFAPALANRIDRNTGGLVIAAKTAPALREITALIRERKIEKFYLTVTEGIPPKAADTLTAYLHKDEKKNKVTLYDAPAPHRMACKTGYRVLDTKANRALLEVELYTGRTHQIRVHFAHPGTPLVGDSLYGTAPIGTRHLLHCKTIRLIHPVREEPVAFDCPFPSDMEEWNQCLPTAPTTSLPASCCPP